MANFDHGPSERAWERSCDRRSLAAHHPRAVCEARENNFCQLHISWLALLRLSAVVPGIEVAGRKLIPNPHSEEKDSTNWILHG
jgi:hypothetical protein